MIFLASFSFNVGMAPKNKRPPTTRFGRSRVTEAMITSYENAGYFRKGLGRAPGSEKISKLEHSEVVVYRDLFTAGLCFPLDRPVTEIFWKYDLYLHHLTPNGVVRLNIYMWVCKTMGIAPSVDTFVRAHRLHHQPLKIDRVADGVTITEEAQFASINFIYQMKPEDCPVVAYKNKWDDGWNQYWFYYRIAAADTVEKHPLYCKSFGNLPAQKTLSPQDEEASQLFIFAFKALSTEYSTRDLLEEFCALRTCPLCSTCKITAWSDSNSPIKIPGFSKCFKITKEGDPSSLFLLF
jgi:hypothetical protein